MSPALSACIIARDEANRLPRCLDALGWVDEIVIVVDDRSRDASETRARADRGSSAAPGRAGSAATPTGAWWWTA